MNPSVAKTLDEIQRALGLSAAELDALFGVPPGTVDVWRVVDVPLANRGAVDDAVRLAQWLVDVRPKRTDLLRQPVAALGNRSPIQFAAEQGVAALLARLAGPAAIRLR